MKIVKQQLAAKRGDSLEFVMSTAAPDRLGDIVEQNWDLSDFHRNPIALFNHRGGEPIGTWRNVRVESGELRGTLEFAEPGIPRIDELRKLTEQGILRAASVGFAPLEYETFKKGDHTGIHFKRNKLLETSLVSIPANADALAIAKALNLSAETCELVFGKSAIESQTARQLILSGTSAANPPLKNGPAKMTPIQKRVEDAQANLVALKDQLQKHIDSLDDSNVTDEQLTVTQELNGKIDQAQKAYDSLKRAEEMLAANSVAVTQQRTVAASDTRPITVPATAKKEIKPADRVMRALVGLVVSRATKQHPMDAMIERCGEDGKIDEGSAIVLRALSRADGMHFRDVLPMVQRTAVIPADTTTSGWASQLVETSIQGFMELLLPASVYPGLAARGLSLQFGRSGIISIPTRAATPTVAGAFVGEGSAIPVKQAAFSSQTLTPKKMAVISVFTRQIAEHSTPAIEGLIRNAIQEDTSTALDSVLLDATAASAIRPAGIRNGVSVTTATAGGGFAALVGDVKNLIGALVTGSSGNLRKPTWIMNPIQALAASLTQNAGGDFPFAAEINQGRFQGYPLILSSTVTAGMVILVDAADFVTVGGDAPRFDVSDQATIHMDDAPSPISTVGTPNVVAAPVRSLWQTDTIGLRMIMDINWAMRRTGVVAWTQAVTW